MTSRSLTRRKGYAQPATAVDSFVAFWDTFVATALGQHGRSGRSVPMTEVDLTAIRVPNRIIVMSDAALLAAYERTDGEPGDPETDALLAEIHRRELDL